MFKNQQTKAFWKIAWKILPGFWTNKQKIVLNSKKVSFNFNFKKIVQFAIFRSNQKLL